MREVERPCRIARPRALTAVLALAGALALLVPAGAQARRLAYLPCTAFHDPFGSVAYGKPRTCFLNWTPRGPSHGLPAAESITLRHLRWSRWGGPTASATGVARPRPHAPYAHVRVTAFDGHRCGTHLLYRRVKVRFRHRTRTWRAYPYCDPLYGT